ncbi:hypothetical protein EPUL_004819, partial [Erysiphe pulchra]
MRSLVIEMITSKFIMGLNNDRLRSRSIERGAASAKTLEECYRIIKDVEKSIIDERKQRLMQQEVWKSQGFDRILEAPHQVSEVLEESAQQTFYNTEHNHTRLSFPQIITLDLQVKENRIIKFERSRQGLAILNENPWREHNQQPPNIQTTGGRYQGPAYNGENPWKGEASWYPRARDFDIRRRERYEKAKLPVPYLNDDLKQSDEIEEMSFDELIAMESALGSSDRDANVVDGTLDRYLLDEPMTENLTSLTYCEEGKCEKCREEDVPTEAQILFSAHVVERDSAKRPRTHHNIINDEDIEPLPKQSVGLDEFGSYHGKNR